MLYTCVSSRVRQRLHIVEFEKTETSGTHVTHCALSAVKIGNRDRRRRLEIVTGTRHIVLRGRQFARGADINEKRETGDGFYKKIMACRGLLCCRQSRQRTNRHLERYDTKLKNKEYQQYTKKSSHLVDLKVIALPSPEPMKLIHIFQLCLS